MFETNIFEQRGDEMLKRERLGAILRMVNASGLVTTTKLMETLNVSDMTIRRDLDELNQSGKLIRIHGGAQSIKGSTLYELSHIEKREIHIDAKQEVAKLGAQFVKEEDTIFIGSGTTLELLAQYIQVNSLRVVTNSLPVFESIQTRDNNWELVLVGGNYRSRSGAFIGNLANAMLETLKYDKTFIGVNGIHNETIMNASAEEGKTQGIALNNAQQKFILADASKLNRDDFYHFYSLYDVDVLITDQSITNEEVKQYSQFTKLVK